MPNIYEDAYLTAGVNALAGTGNRIGLYKSNGTRVGTVYADTTWAAAVLSGSGGAKVATRTGSEVTITVPSGACAAGDVITHYGVLNGTTLLKRIELEPVSLTVNRADMAFDVRVTPSLIFDPVE